MNIEHNSDAEQESEPIAFQNDDVKLPPDLEDTVVRALKRRGLIRTNKLLRSVPFKIAASILIISGIFMIGRMTSEEHQSVAAPKEDIIPTYALLLYDPADFNTAEVNIDEYVEWFKEYHRKGVVSSGQELATSGWVFEKQDAQPVSGTVASTHGLLSGFFLIKAATSREALDIASTCPHLKYRGVLELRTLQ